MMDRWVGAGGRTDGRRATVASSSPVASLSHCVRSPPSASSLSTTGTVSAANHLCTKAVKFIRLLLSLYLHSSSLPLISRARLTWRVALASSASFPRTLALLPSLSLHRPLLRNGQGNKRKIYILPQCLGGWAAGGGTMGKIYCGEPSTPSFCAGRNRYRRSW